MMLIIFAKTRFARKLFITDYDEKTLHLASRNLARNSEHFPGLDSRVVIRKLDWFTHEDSCFACQHLAAAPSPCRPTESAPSSTSFEWMASDAADLSGVSWILAADVIYDDVITDAFFKKLSALLGGPGDHRVCYLSLEKRYNFSLEAMAVVANGYQRFRDRLCIVEHGDEGELESRQNSPSSTPFPRLVGRQIAVDKIPQAISLPGSRGRAIMELWEIRCSH